MHNRKLIHCVILFCATIIMLISGCQKTYHLNENSDCSIKSIFDGEWEPYLVRTTKYWYYYDMLTEKNTILTERGETKKYDKENREITNWREIKCDCMITHRTNHKFKHKMSSAGTHNITMISKDTAILEYTPPRKNDMVEITLVDENVMIARWIRIAKDIRNSKVMSKNYFVLVSESVHVRRGSNAFIKADTALSKWGGDSESALKHINKLESFALEENSWGSKASNTVAPGPRNDTDAVLFGKIIIKSETINITPKKIELKYYESNRENYKTMDIDVLRDGSFLAYNVSNKCFYGINNIYFPLKHGDPVEKYAKIRSGKDTVSFKSPGHIINIGVHVIKVDADMNIKHTITQWGGSVNGQDMLTMFDRTENANWKPFVVAQAKRAEARDFKGTFGYKKVEQRTVNKLRGSQYSDSLLYNWDLYLLKCPNSNREYQCKILASHDDKQDKESALVVITNYSNEPLEIAVGQEEKKKVMPSEALFIPVPKNSLFHKNGNTAQFTVTGLQSGRVKEIRHTRTSDETGFLFEAR